MLDPTPTEVSSSSALLRPAGLMERYDAWNCRQKTLNNVHDTLTGSLFHVQHCVFGKVVEGMDVVKAVEAVGSQSGTTRSKVMIAASGQL